MARDSERRDHTDSMKVLAALFNAGTFHYTIPLWLGFLGVFGFALFMWWRREWVWVGLCLLGSVLIMAALVALAVVSWPHVG